jgi:hypothetical protein
MKTLLPSFVLLTLVLTACSSGPIRIAQVEDTINRYGAAIRFGEYERAQEFQPPAKRKPLDLNWLKNVHVSSYDITYRKENQGGNVYEMTVNIRYFIEPYGVEQTLIDHQVWRYDETRKTTILESDLPVFR